MQSDGSVMLTVMVKTLTVANASEFRVLARPVIEASSGGVVVDCSELDFIDSSGVGAFLYANSLLPELRRPVRLIGVGPQVLASLELMMVHRQFDMEPRK